MEKYLKEKYEETKFPYFSVVELKNLGFTKEDAQKLIDEKKIKGRLSATETLIEYIPDKL